MSEQEKINRLKHFDHAPKRSLGQKVAIAFCILATGFGLAAIVGLFMLMKDSFTS